MRNVSYMSLVAVSTIAAMVLQATSLILPIALNIFYSHTRAQVSWLGCAIGGGLCIGILLSSMAMSYLPKVKVQIIVVSALNLAFLGAMSAASPSWLAYTIAFSLISSITLGYAVHMTFVGSTYFCEAQDIGLVVGFLSFVKSLGSSVSLIMYLTFFSNRIEKYSIMYIGAVASKADLSQERTTALISMVAGGEKKAVPGVDSDVFIAALEAFSRAASTSLRQLYYALIPAAACLVLVSFFVPDFAPHLNDMVARRLQGPKDLAAEKQTPQTHMELQHIRR